MGFVNFTLNANDGSNYIKDDINLNNILERTNPLSISKQRNNILKNISIHTLEICSSSRGCTPKKQHNINTKRITTNYLTKYKNSQHEIITNKAKNKKNYVLLNIKGSCRIGDKNEDIAIRIPRSGIVGIKISMSIQNEILVHQLNADNKINILKDELSILFYELFPDVIAKRKTELSGMTVHGWNINDPYGGQRPPQRIKNFKETMSAMNQFLPTHTYRNIQTNSTAVVKANFKPVIKGYFPTFGITKWLMVDFLGVRLVSQVRDLSNLILIAYTNVSNSIKWNSNFDGPIPQSRRKKEVIPPVNVNNKNNNENMPLWNKNKKKALYKTKSFQCMQHKKEKLKEIARKLQVNPDGTKTDICKRIIDKIKI